MYDVSMAYRPAMYMYMYCIYVYRDGSYSLFRRDSSREWYRYESSRGKYWYEFIGELGS